MALLPILPSTALAHDPDSSTDIASTRPPTTRVNQQHKSNNETEIPSLQNNSNMGFGLCAAWLSKEMSEEFAYSSDDSSDNCSESSSDTIKTAELGGVAEPDRSDLDSGHTTLGLLTLCDVIAKISKPARRRGAGRRAVAITNPARATQRGWWEDNESATFNHATIRKLGDTIDEHIATLEDRCAPIEEEWRQVQQAGTRTAVREWRESGKDTTLEMLRTEVVLLMTARNSLSY